MKTFGNVTNVLTDIEYTYNYDEDSGNSLTVTYETPEEKALQVVPALGSTTGKMPGVVLLKAIVRPGEGGISSVRLEYGKPKDDDEKDADEGGTDKDDGKDDDEDLVEQTVEGSVSDEPLLSHPKAQQGMTDAQREYLKAVIDGTRMWELVNELESDGSPKKDKDGQPVMKPLSQLLKTSGNVGEVLKLILQGIHSYRAPCATYRIVRTVSNKDVNLGGIGQIATPEGAPSVTNQNWMLVGRSYSRESKSAKSKSTKWRLEEVYELSAPGGWNTTLYS